MHNKAHQAPKQMVSLTAVSFILPFLFRSGWRVGWDWVHSPQRGECPSAGSVFQAVSSCCARPRAQVLVGRCWASELRPDPGSQSSAPLEPTCCQEEPHCQFPVPLSPEEKNTSSGKFHKAFTRTFLQVTSSVFGLHKWQIIPSHQKTIKAFYLPVCINFFLLKAPSNLDSITGLLPVKPCKVSMPDHCSQLSATILFNKSSGSSKHATFFVSPNQNHLGLVTKELLRDQSLRNETQRFISAARWTVHLP